MMREHNHTFHCMHGELQQLIDRAQDLVDATTDKLDDGIQAARHTLIDGLEGARLRAAQLEERLGTRADQARLFVEENPFQAVGLSLAAGFFLGWVLRR